MHFKRNITVVPPYFDKYIAHVPEDLDLFTGLSKEIFDNHLLTELENIPNKAYAKGKWTVKQCIQHISDTERVFQYRALRISRNDTTPLPGFDQDQYASSADVDNRSFKSLYDELIAVRKSSIFLFESLGPKELRHVGICSDNEISVLALGFTTIGHQIHHKKLFLERYLN
jgi:hypothetical protein